MPAALSNLPTDLRVTATEFAFAPSTTQVPAGKNVTITLDNKGVIVHDLVVQGTDFMLDARAGQTAKGEFTFDAPGTYELICSIPGRKEAGMKGTLTVVGAESAAPLSAAAPVRASAPTHPNPLYVGPEPTAPVGAPPTAPEPAPPPNVTAFVQTQDYEEVPA